MHRTARVALALSILITGSALAQNNRSAVASTGLDTNPCTVASPCRSFSTAATHTNTGGEIVALDSAGYGPFSIGVAMTVSGAPGVHAAITATSGDAIDILAPGANVTIRNLILIGAGAGTAVFGGVAADLYVSNCLVRGFFYGATVQNGDATFDHCTFLSVTASAITATNGGAGVNRVIVTDSVLDHNGDGINAADAIVQVVAVRCTISGSNTAVGVVAATGSGFTPVVTVKDCTIVGNENGVSAISSAGNTASVYLSNNVIAYNATAVYASGMGAQVYTYSNNTIHENTSLGSSMNAVSLQ